MKNPILFAPLACVLLLLLGVAHAKAAADEGEVADLLFGGCGGAYFLVEPGELVIEVLKRDTNMRGSPAFLRAILAGPDRAVLEDVEIPDDGHARGSGMGPLQQVRFSTRVERKGIYALNITISQDRYGTEAVWGIRTNCDHYLIETARGHKDERHQEPIVLSSPQIATEVCFRPRAGKFDIDVDGLPGSVKQLTLSRADGELVQQIPVREGKAMASLAATESREGIPWRLYFPSAQGTLDMDGLTRWERGELSENMCIWTPDVDSWFPFLEHRWLLTPYSRTVYTEPEEVDEVWFQVHNNSKGTQSMRLSLEFSAEPWPVRLSRDTVSLSPGESVRVALCFTAPAAGEESICHLRVTPEDSPDFTTYSTLRIKAEAPPPVETPILFQPYRHENELFGYLPDYPTENQMYFDLQNRPFTRKGNGIATIREGEWVTIDLDASTHSGATTLRDASFQMVTTKIAFDRDNDLYLLAQRDGRSAYLHSTDGGSSFEAYEIPGPRGVFDIEQFSGHNTPDTPPPFVRFVAKPAPLDPNLRWRRENELALFVPRKVGGRIEIGEPIVISEMCIGLSAHSGIPSSVVSRGSKVHVAWGEASDPKASRKEVPGVPTFVVSYDREKQQLGKPALIGFGPPPNDVHNSPSITMDSDGYLHVLIGTHGQPFQYLRSLQSNHAEGGWTEPVLAGEGLGQTYIGFVCGRDNTLHTVFRLWQSGDEYGPDPYPHSSHATLAYQRKRPGEPWEPPKILCHAPFSEYSIFYHRLTIDQKGRLFVSKDYWSTYWFYRNDHFGDRRSLLMSPDGGATWALVGDEDLVLP